MEIKELRSLVALSELGSISLAAEQLHLSPPAIHKQLKILEAELGVTLYEKVGRGLQLTQAAEIVLPYARELLAQYDSARAALQEWKGMKRGVVRVGTGPSAYVLPEILKKFRRQYPGVEVLVETGNTPVLLDGLGRGSLDLALLVSADLVEKDVHCVETSWEFELVMVSHQRHPIARPRLAELRQHRFILFRKGSRMQEPIDRWFAAHNFEPNVIMRFDNAEFIRSMVRSGMGLSLLPFWVVHRDIKEHRLTMIRPAEAPLHSKIALVRRKSAFVPRPVQAFIESARAIDARHLRLLVSHQASGQPSGAGNEPGSPQPHMGRGLRSFPPSSPPAVRKRTPESRDRAVGPQIDVDERR